MRKSDHPAWLSDAIFYEIYPQSFADSNGDGIGDFPGATARLDYLAWLGINTIWFNPCFDSPFVDAGYDVSDYFQVAPRYGTNEDLIEFMRQAKARGIRVILDLVAGHTSNQHEWFVAESALEAADPAGDRYVWGQPNQEQLKAQGVLAGSPWVKSPGRRAGYYLRSFFDEQPALNFGYARLVADEPWRDPVDAAGPRRNRQMLHEVINYWVSQGAAGFRVDMAFSLVKDDVDGIETAKLWQEQRQRLQAKHPEAVLIPEGAEITGGRPQSFDGGFFLVIGDQHSSLFNNGGAGTLPWWPQTDCYFNAKGDGSTDHFLSEWRKFRADLPGRPIIMAAADHDYSRMHCGSRDWQQLRSAFTFLFTWSCVPGLYYGEEIGMRFLPGLPNKEGSICNPGYNRAGCRTPMQWDNSVNAGFSTAAPERLYLPIDPAADRPNVADQIAQPNSHLQFVRELVALRRNESALNSVTDPEILNSGYPLAFTRDSQLLVVLNPSGAACETQVSVEVIEELIGEGVTVSAGVARCEPFGYGVFRIAS